LNSAVRRGGVFWNPGSYGALWVKFTNLRFLQGQRFGGFGVRLVSGFGLIGGFSGGVISGALVICHLLKE
jgi:hypothetical protein